MTRQKSRKEYVPKENPIEKSLARYRELLDPREFVLLVEELEKPLFGGLRINPLKTRGNELKTWCDRYGWISEPVPFCPSGYRLVSRTTNPGNTLEHRMGFYYLQDAASMLPPELFNFDPKDHPLILDMAASPGGKTTHLVSRTGDTGVVIANDGSRARIPALRSVLQTWGSVNNAITCLPGESFGGNFPEAFDAVLLDAPCSMDGLRATEAHPLRPITESERASLVRRQTAMLRSALQAVRPGGQVVYSTCTLAPEEDEAVLDDILRAFPGQVQVEDLSAERSISAPALAADGRRVYQPTVRNAFRLWPHTFKTAGFFAARLRKIHPVQPDKQSYQERAIPGEKLVPLPKSQANSVIDFIRSTYGFDLEPILDTNKLLLANKKDIILLMPEKLVEHFPSLKCISAGMNLADVSPDGLELSHDFCSRFGHLIPAGWIELPEPLQAPWLRGEDINREALSDLSRNRIVLIRDSRGEFIGRGRVTSDRVKNLLPRKVLL
jgi:16S rRNA (cytosine1407-C5)-methyltransferase